MENKPLVSVCMITYNHEDFISQAIEGALMQKTDFPIELVIGEDCSTDRTREICLEYQQKYPEIIRILPREKNLGMMPNFVDTLKNCQGKYIALCEGDDYWDNQQKLSYQVDFLEANLDYSGVCTSVKRYFQDTKKFEKEPYYKNLGLKQKEDITTEKLLKGFLIRTATLMFRNNLFEPNLIKNFCFGDKFLQLLISTKGDICFFNQEDTVYRVHRGGAMHTIIPQNVHKFFKDYYDFLIFFNEHTNFKYDSSVKYRQHYLKITMNLSNKSGNFSSKVKNTIKYFLTDDSRHSMAEYNNIFTLAFPKTKSKLKMLLRNNRPGKLK